MAFVSLADKQINGCSPDKQEDRGRREVELKPVELALTEEHMSCVTGKNERLRLLANFHCRSNEFKTLLLFTVNQINLKLLFCVRISHTFVIHSEIPK